MSEAMDIPLLKILELNLKNKLEIEYPMVKHPMTNKYNFPQSQQFLTIYACIVPTKSNNAREIKPKANKEVDKLVMYKKENPAYALSYDLNTNQLFAKIEFYKAM